MAWNSQLAGWSLVDLLGGMAADVPPQEQTEEIIKGARAVVDAARKLEGESSGRLNKRKAEELDEDLDEKGDSQLQPSECFSQTMDVLLEPKLASPRPTTSRSRKSFGWRD